MQRGWHKGSRKKKHVSQKQWEIEPGEKIALTSSKLKFLIDSRAEASTKREKEKQKNRRRKLFRQNQHAEAYGDKHVGKSVKEMIKSPLGNEETSKHSKATVLA